MFTNQNKLFSNLLHTFLLSDLYTGVAPLKEDAFVWLAYWRKKRSVHTSYIAIFIACGKTVEKWDSSSWAKGSIERRSKGVGIQWVDTLSQTGLKRIQLLSKITLTSLVMSSSWNFWAELSWKGSEPSRAELKFMYTFWNVLFLECALFGMCPFWNVLFLECALFGICSFWNMLFLECALFEMSFFCNVLFL